MLVLPLFGRGFLGGGRLGRGSLLRWFWCLCTAPLLQDDEHEVCLTRRLGRFLRLYLPGHFVFLLCSLGVQERVL